MPTPGEQTLAGSIPWRSASDVPIDFEGPDIAFSPFDPIHGPETPILALIAAQNEAAPDRIAIEDDEGIVTYGTLMDAIYALAASIAAAVPPAQPVGIRLHDTRQGPIALLACLLAATPAVLLDRMDPPDRLAKLVAASRLAAIITEDEFPGLICIKPTARAAAPFAARPLAQDAPAFVVWTSGSSGQPKGIVHSQRSVLHRAGLLVNSAHLGSTDRYLSFNTPSSMGALLNALAAFLSGAALHRVDIARYGLARVLRRLRDKRITAVMGVPAIYRAIAQMPGASAAMSSVRVLSSNGEALLAADLALLRSCLPPTSHIQMVYGATETQAAMRFIPTSEKSADAQVAAGRPIPGTQFAVIREDGTPAPDGEAGELFIRSRYTAIGEWQEGRCIEGRLRYEVDTESGWRHYAMGDLVRLRSDGNFLVIGRSDRQLKLRGHRIEPIEIEAILRGDAAVHDSVVLPIAGPVGPELVAFVAVEPRWHAETRLRLDALLTARIPGYMRPRRLHLLPALPLLSSNKIDIFSLTRLDASTTEQQ